VSTGERVATDPLAPLATPSGRFAMLALDHRDAFRSALARAGVEDPDAAAIRERKEAIAAALAPVASALLLDHDSVPRCRAGDRGLLVPLEAQGHEPLEGGRLNRLELDAPAAAAVGADGCKLLLYYRPDHEPTARRQRALVEHAAGAPDAAYAARFGDLVVATARDLAASPIDLLKAQFPGESLCGELDEAVGELPWALLGGSEVDGEVFARQLDAACAAGASGFIAGRAIWGGSLGLEPPHREEWLAETARPLFERLVEIVERSGRSDDTVPEER
jgi:tagatose-1,6-bisphosphate aldolase